MFAPSPICGENFCDDCGDCLHCYGEDTCVISGLPHRDYNIVVKAPSSSPSHPVGHPVMINPSWQPKDISRVPDAAPGQGDKL